MKGLKKIFLIAGILAACLVIVIAVYLIRAAYEASKMTPIETGEIIDGVYAINSKGFVNMYLIEDGDNYIAIDAANSEKDVRKELGKLNISPDAVSAVFLTHTDGDHVGAVGLFKYAKIYLASEEEQMINGKTARAMLIMKNKLGTDYTLLSDNQEFEIYGLSIKCILTPGHTPGSMSYVINDKYLFTGDTLSLREGQVELGSKFYNMDSETEKGSIQKLSSLENVEYIFTSHYGYTDHFTDAISHWR